MRFKTRSQYDGQVRVNLKSREAYGKVELDDYCRELDRIEIELNHLRDIRTDAKLVSAVTRPLESDPLEAGPSQCDLRITWGRGACGAMHPEAGQIGPFPHRRTGGHTGEYGFAALVGCGLEPGFQGRRSSMDVAPTLAELSGLRAGNVRFSGRSLLCASH